MEPALPSVFPCLTRPSLFAFLFKPEIAVKFDFLDTISTTAIIVSGVIINPYVTYRKPRAGGTELWERTELVMIGRNKKAEGIAKAKTA